MRAETLANRDYVAVFLWLWVVAVIAAYLWQFVPLFGPILAAVRGEYP